MRRLGRSMLVCCLCLLLGVPLAALGSKRAQYDGGTITAIPTNAEGTLITDNEQTLSFKWKGGQVDIPYTSITDLEYGQKAGRRVAVAVLISPFALFSKKRKHYLTISYKDTASKEQAGVFELGKDIVRTTLTIIETRSGKKIQYQDEEARKSGMGGGLR